MPVLTHTDLDTCTLATNQYGYSATRLPDLGAAEYTLVTIVCDDSGSVVPFRRDLIEAFKRIIQACQYSPRADNLLVRMVSFSNTLSEIHGFKLLAQCQVSDYDNVLTAGGATALYDAAENAVAATQDYAERLARGSFSANAIVFVLTDGMDNASTLTAASVKRALSKIVTDEALESMISILIGVNVQDKQVGQALQAFHKEAGFTRYVEMKHADARVLATLADFVSRSISAQSQALGTGGPSRSLSF